jgi:Domain of unknown function (DUF4386)
VTATTRTKDPTRRTALVAGILYLITFASSIPAVFLLGPALTNPDYITGAGPDGLVRFGALLDLVNCFTAVGTAVALYSVVKRQHEGLALGFVTTRMMEAAILFVATLAILSVVTLREAGAAGADAATLVTVGQSLVAVRDWSFVIGTGVPALNALMLGTLMYRSRLVPRAIPALGLIGVVTFGSWVVGYILGVAEAGTPWHSVGVAPIFFWELTLGLWMTFKGFRAPAVAALYADSAIHREPAAAVSAQVAVAAKPGAA